VSALVSAAAAVQQSGDGCKQTEEDHLSADPHVDGIVVARHSPMCSMHHVVGGLLLDHREDREVWKQTEGGGGQRQTGPSG